ncbi:chloroplast sensor kinase, chloroplastic [Telopea speciosissima]|uniref:chloroplast sensor kinase, chloroplastic n=1 Tax=Telopea speciosissima TaxID=54955 RepID=UPI001CC6E87D|nr:chloroplast sensor kinase, chloroplastic [Telopea speciosissima]
MMFSAITAGATLTGHSIHRNAIRCCPFNNQNPCLLLYFQNHTSSRRHASPQKHFAVTRNENETETFHLVTDSGSSEGGEKEDLVPSASALAAAIRNASTSPVEFEQRIKGDGKNGLVLPSPDFQNLCMEQLNLFQRIIHPDAVLSVYVRPAGSYVMDQLELRRVILYPRISIPDRADVIVLIGNFGIPTGSRAAEATLSNRQVEIIPECRALVFPMVKHPFVVGFLVAELPMMDFGNCRDSDTERQDISLGSSLEEACGLPPCSGRKMWEIQTFKEDSSKTDHKFTAEQISSAINISRSLACAYVMDQKGTLLQQSSWQNNVRMSNLVEQIRGPLSSIRTLSKMLSIHMKRSEISYDIVEDILVQGDHMRDTLQQLQDAVYLTKANVVRYNEETLRRIHNSTYPRPESVRSRLPESNGENHGDSEQKSGPTLPRSASGKDLEMPMPPLALAALQQHNIRPCNVSDMLEDLVAAARPLAHKQKRTVELSEFPQSFQVSVEESDLRQALSNLIEGALLRTHVGGKVQIVSMGAPAGGALVVIDDDGPDMHYMTQMHSLTPFGVDLFSEGMIEDNRTWNFVAGLAVAREILESYGCVVRVISPRTPDAALGAGGTRIELWLPSHPDASGPNSATQTA